jgi:hypothetical protein
MNSKVERRREILPVTRERPIIQRENNAFGCNVN